MKVICVNYTNYKYSVKQNIKSSNKVYEKNLSSTKDEPYNYNAITFYGLKSPCTVKQRGMLMHITSLPANRSFCGQFLDEQTEQFIQWLKKSKQTHWIMNPLNALGDDLCPYNSLGRFSRNKYIVNLNKLTESEYGNILKEDELPDDIPVQSFTLEMLEKQKNPRFIKAFERFKKLDKTAPIKKEYNEFVKDNDDLWLDSYACYDVISKQCKCNWTEWNKQLQTIPEDAKKENVTISDKTKSVLKQLNPYLEDNSLQNDIDLYKFEQFLFDKQLHQQVDILKENGIRLMTDLPIGVSPTGVDTWSKKNIFLLDSDFKPNKVSGCIPEKPYGYTQVWGHALYNYDSPDFWDYQENSLRQLIQLSDLRLDHFVGYVNRAEIPTEYKKSDGTILRGQDIFKPKKEGGMGSDFFLPEWITDISKKRNSNGENMFDLFIRLANECGKSSTDTYVLESFGDLSKTDAYKNFIKEYGKYFIGQLVPLEKYIFNRKATTGEYNSVLLTGNHDLPSLKERVDDLTGNGNRKLSLIQRIKFYLFCRKKLNLTKDEMKNSDEIYKNILKLHYTKNVQEVQTTVQDALGLYWRPNIPGFWNGTYDKYSLKPTKEALLPFWNKVFARDFLIRTDKNGIHPGYKDKADEFIELMNS